MQTLSEKFKEFLYPKLKKPAFYGLLAGFFMLLFLIIQSIRLNLLQSSQILLASGLLVFLLLLAYGFCYMIKGKLSSLAGWLCLIGLFCFGWTQVSAYSQMRSDLEQSCAPVQSVQDRFVFYTEKDQDAYSLQSMQGKKVGFLAVRNDADNQKAIDQLSRQDIEIEPVYYNNLNELMSSLKGQKISYIGLNSYDIDLYEMLNFSYTNDSNEPLSVKNLVTVGQLYLGTSSFAGNGKIDVTTTPFTLLSRIYGDEQYQRLLAVELSVINPIIQEVYTVIIPRDYWVSYQCSEGENACSISSDRIAYAAYLGEDHMVSVVENLLAVQVDFVANVNLDGLLPLLDVSFLSIENPQDIIYKNSYFEQGELDLISEKARIYAQIINEVGDANRSFDNNAYRVLKAFLNANIFTSLPQVEEKIEDISKGLRTSFSYSQLSDLLRMFVMEKNNYLYIEQSLDGHDAYLYSPMLTSYAHVITPDQQSLNEISQNLAAKLAQRQRGDDQSYSEPVEYVQGEVGEEQQEEEIQDEAGEDEVQEEPDYYDPYEGYYGYDPYADYGLYDIYAGYDYADDYYADDFSVYNGNNENEDNFPADEYGWY